MFLGGMGEGLCDVDLQRTRFYVGYFFYVFANFDENRSRNATVRVRTDGYTHRDAHRFYNLSDAICYSYGTDN